MRLEGKTAVINGGSRNIGREVALTFAREGADLVLNTRSSQEELESVAAQCRELGVNTHTVLGDVSDPERVSQMVQEGINALGARLGIDERGCWVDVGRAEFPLRQGFRPPGRNCTSLCHPRSPLAAVASSQGGEEFEQVVSGADEPPLHLHLL